MIIAFSLLTSISISYLLLLLSSVITIVVALPTSDPCISTFDSHQRLLSDDSITGYSLKGCQEACAAQEYNGGDSNGMCVLDQCYCTDVGIGDCRDNNHEGCDAICQQLSLDWVGACIDSDCQCLS